MFCYIVSELRIRHAVSSVIMLFRFKVFTRCITIILIAKSFFFFFLIKRISVINQILGFLPAFCIRFSYRFIRVTWVPKKTYWPVCATRAVVYGRYGPSIVGYATGACSISTITASSSPIAWASATGNANIVFGDAVGANTPVCDVKRANSRAPPRHGDEVVRNLSRAPVESFA